MVRGVVSLPHGTGKEVRVLVLCTPDAEACLLYTSMSLPHHTSVFQSAVPLDKSLPLPSLSPVK